MTLITLVRRVKRLKRRLCEMAKNKRQTGKSVRHGNLPSPYQKYQKTPFRYSSAYYEWRSAVIANKPAPKRKEYKANDREKVRDYRMAAE